MRFVDQRLHFLERVLLRTGVSALGEHAAGAAELDDVGAIFDVAADCGPHADDAIGSAFGAVVEFRREQIIVAVTAGDSERRTRRENAGAGDLAVVDRIAHRDVAEADRADVANGGHSRQ